MIDELIKQMRENDQLLAENQGLSKDPIGGAIPGTTGPAPAVADAVIDFNKPRIGLVAKGAKAGLACPQCKTPIIEQEPVYLVGLIDPKGAVIDQFYLNVPIGLFCPKCPTSLLDVDRAEEMIQINNPDIRKQLSKGCRVAVLGIVVETDAETNQTKIVPFNAAPATQRKPLKSKKKPKLKKKKKRSKK